MKFLPFIILISCNSKDVKDEITESYSYKQIDEVSPDSLDRTIETARQMNEDLERMNQNLNAIFKAVTDCKSDEECESLKLEMAQKNNEKCQSK